jgi:hypothetical protein
MLRYDLRLYRYRDEASPSGREGVQIEFEAEDDRAAVARALSDFAGRLAACQYALLSSVGGRLVWQKRASA